MGFLERVSTVQAPARAAGFSRGTSPGADAWYLPDGWVSSLAMAGVAMSPELAMTLSYVYSAVDIISSDFGTMPCAMYRDLGEGGRARVRFGDPGIGGLAYLLRWQPNSFQSAKAFWSTMAWQYLLRPAAYAEMTLREGSQTVIDEITPRHPDRVTELRLPSGRFVYKLDEPKGPPRYVSQDAMFVVRNTSSDGLNAIGRIGYGGRTLDSGLALQEYTRQYFKKGATAALMATYKGGQMGDEEEAALHRSITRYIAGVENAGGLLLVPDDIDVKSLGVDPEKAQLLGLKDLSGRDVARIFKLPPYKLAIAGTQAYASQVQSAQDYVTTCQMPIVREFQDAIYIHMIVARDYYAKFNSSHLLQADQKTRMEAHEIAIRARVYRPSEARVMEDMSPDEELDRLSALDHRPGSSSSRDGANNGEKALAAGRGCTVRAVLATHDSALRVLRRERVAVEKIAKKHASSAEGWRRELKSFYEEHANFVAETMRIPTDVARAYAAQHGEQLETLGMPAWTEHWEKLEAEDLVELAMDHDTIGRVMARRTGEHAHA